MTHSLRSEDGMSAADDALADAFFEARKADLEQRLKPKRFRHSLGVSQTAEALARTYGADVATARLAGLLHDWDKCLDDQAIRDRARDLGADVPDLVLQAMPQLLHGPTAARALAREFPQIPPEALSAIEKHTAASVDMSDLDLIVYVADVIEPNRSFDGVDKLRRAVGRVGLEDLFLLVFQHSLENLVATGKRLHPDTVDVWNHYVERKLKREGTPSGAAKGR
ncbi:bis(5'-nucleosyl)-tetraphosphatase (symmetrical) YqeK [Xiamenia xianingshaonis]|uniref:bis(5'-nucleosyl)-tetraphosphatase (symmetrical) YqeK n=1 Tax=Xiamenia xianingshaonis TaxID=2682776 RepID=UPI0021BD60E4|nr:bis(5'-nucleosyl)-tetraphosphatase (symmetrical) YqeK [Xiamenia xianingshaonis]